MKKQYIAPSVEIELYGVSAFCSGCVQTISDYTFGMMADQGCLDQFFSEYGTDADDCYNSPYDIQVINS